MEQNKQENNKILEEFKRCKTDPVYFICKYIKVTHPVRGLVNFDLYDFQKTIVSELQDHRFNILRKFRQAGCTTSPSWHHFGDFRAFNEGYECSSGQITRFNA